MPKFRDQWPEGVLVSIRAKHAHCYAGGGDITNVRVAGYLLGYSDYDEVFICSDANGATFSDASYVIKISDIEEICSLAPKETP